MPVFIPPPPLPSVLVIGASGNLGRVLIPHLLAAGHTVSALTRSTSTSTATLPEAITVHRTDYSHGSLLAAFRGVDAIVSVTSTYSTATQKNIIDAAVEAGVKHFLPSEYGVDTSQPSISEVLPPALMKQETVAYLRTKESAGLSWTALCVGAWFDWPLELGLMGWDVRARRATIYDGGAVPYEATNVPQVARAIVKVLEHLEETRNQYVYIHSFTTTQRTVLAALEDAVGAKFSVTGEGTERLEREALQKLKAAEGVPVPDGGYADGAVDNITAAIYGYGGLNAFGEDAKRWMEVLGMEEEGVGECVRSVVEKMGLGQGQ